MRGRHRSAFAQPASDEPSHRELLDGARVDRERLRMWRPLRTPFQDDRAHSPAVQFGREPHANRAAANDGYVVGSHARKEWSTAVASGSGTSGGSSPLDRSAAITAAKAPGAGRRSRGITPSEVSLWQARSAYGSSVDVRAAAMAADSSMGWRALCVDSAR